MEETNKLIWESNELWTVQCWNKIAITFKGWRKDKILGSTFLSSKFYSTVSDEIIRETGNENVVLHHVDLSSFKSVRELAAVVNRTEAKIDILIHNAGYSNYLERCVSLDGVEMTMATNHYGPFLLTHLLIDLLKKSAPCRIVVVASKTHTLSFMNPMNNYHLNPVGFRLPMFLYGNSKYANILMTLEMARRLKDFNITVNCLHPGRSNFSPSIARFKPETFSTLQPLQVSSIQEFGATFHSQSHY